MVRKLNWLVASTSTTFQRAITWTQTWAQITSQVRGSMKDETKVREAILARPIRPWTHIKQNADVKNRHKQNTNTPRRWPDRTSEVQKQSTNIKQITTSTNITPPRPFGPIGPQGFTDKTHTYTTPHTHH